jgi:hypothetical protein
MWTAPVSVVGSSNAERGRDLDVGHIARAEGSISMNPQGQRLVAAQSDSTSCCYHAMG